MADLRSLRRFHLTLRMLWWGLLVVPLLGGGFVGARLGFPMGVRTATVLFLGGAVVLVLVHVSHLARRPGCPRCLQMIDWLALAREAHNAGMEPDAYMELVRPWSSSGTFRDVNRAIGCAHRKPIRDRPIDTETSGCNR